MIFDYPQTDIRNKFYLIFKQALNPWVWQLNISALHTM